MKRSHLQEAMHLRIPKEKQIRVIVDSDVRNEADDPFAIAHFLLTPLFDVRGIIAAHHESKAVIKETTMMKNYEELKKLMDASNLEDVPIFKGCVRPLADEDEAIESEGCDFIINEAKKHDERPLYIAVLGTMTDVASAINKEPEIAEKLTVVFTGGQSYPKGGPDFNFAQDIRAVRCLFASDANVWQIPLQVYSLMSVTMAELAYKVRPQGKLGKYLYEQIEEYNLHNDDAPGLRRGENWSLGDSPTVGALLETEWRGNFHYEIAPYINDDMTYSPSSSSKEIRVYDSIDTRMILEDFYAKLALYAASESD